MPQQHTPWPDLALLDLLLDREGMARDPNVWFTIHKLLLSRAAQGRSPETPEAIARLLGPLVCKSPQHQQRIEPVIAEWLSGAKPAVQTSATVPKSNTGSHWQHYIRRFNRRYMAGVAALLLLFFVLVIIVIKWPHPTKFQFPVIAVEPGYPVPAPILPIQPVTITDWVPPNPSPPPENPQHSEAVYWMTVVGLPALSLLLWLIWRYRERMILRGQQNDDEKRITGLRIKDFQQSPTAPFSGAKMAGALNPLLRPVWIETQYLHVQDSVMATANRFGFFTPVYRQRAIRPEYLILVQSVHGKDQMADVAELFIQALKSKKISIRGYRFRDDPRRLTPIALAQPAEDADKSALSLTQLGQKRGDARLIVISDWSIAFEPYSPNLPQAWIKELDHWEKRIWLSPGYDNPQWAELAREQAQRLNIRLLPLASHNAQDLALWLAQENNPPAPLGQTDDQKFPPILSETAETWLGWRPPHGADLKRLLKELRSYLGAEGFLLLQALAAFPKPIWPLPQILDMQLSSVAAASPTGRFPWRRKTAAKTTPKPDTHLQCQERESRLLRIGRLPWSRHAHMPDYLRELLLKALNRSDRKTIRLAWTALLAKTCISKNEEPIDLPIAVPKTGKVQVQNLLLAQTRDNALDDAIFASILLGGKLGLLDFRLPRALAKLLPNAGKWLDLGPALTALVLASLSVWGFNLAWQTYGKQALTRFTENWIAQENAAWRIELDYQPDTRMLANLLQKTLLADKFQATEQQGISQSKGVPNTVSYATGGKRVAQRVAQTLAWLSYGAIKAVDVSESPTLPAHTIKVQLNQTYQHTAGFNDELRQPYQKYVQATEPKPDSLPIEPDMVIIKPGKFLMGSSEKEPSRFDIEGPQHAVSIAYAFAIGKTEVTFAEYDRFAGATGRTLPDDYKWGRGNRPVINVSFADAQAYARWLAQQTGKNYRLPTEAEWEYAARAGSTTAYWWGDSIGKNYAVCRDCGSQWDGRETAPVGSFMGNHPFGLYDTAGNVWEWTQDCWHENYNQAPGDGSAWLESVGGDCGRRVVRGGSWDNDPRGLRSANRGGAITGGADNDVGFRIARTL